MPKILESLAPFSSLRPIFPPLEMCWLHIDFLSLIFRGFFCTYIMGLQSASAAISYISIRTKDGFAYKWGTFCTAKQLRLHYNTIKCAEAVLEAANHRERLLLLKMEDRGRERRRKPRATKQQRSEKEGPYFYVLLRMNFFCYQLCKWFIFDSYFLGWKELGVENSTKGLNARFSGMKYTFIEVHGRYFMAGCKGQ